MTDLQANLVTCAVMAAVVLPFAIPPLCRYRVCYAGMGFLHLTRKGALRTAAWAEAKGYGKARVEHAEGGYWVELA